MKFTFLIDWLRPSEDEAAPLRWLRGWLGRRLLERVALFRRIPRTPAITMTTGLLWTVPLAAFSGYVNLYMVRLGLGEAELGMVHSLSKGLAFVFFLLGGYLVDLWGRRRSLVVFDLLSWVGYGALLVLARDKWLCAAALLLHSTNAVANTAYQCLLVEGTKPSTRARVYGVHLLINIGPSLLFLPLLGGLLVESFGLVSAVRGMLAAFTLLVLVGILLRARLLPDDRGAQGALPPAPREGLREARARYAAVLRDFLSRPGARAFTASRILDQWVRLTWQIYAGLYIVDHLGVREGHLALLVQGQAFFVFLIFLVVVPAVPPPQLRAMLGFDQILGGLGFALFLLAPGEEALLVGFAAVFLLAASAVLNQSVNEAMWMTFVREEERAKVVGAVNGWIQLSLLFAGPLAGLLYEKVSPAALVAALLVLHAAAYVLMRGVRRTMEPSRPAPGIR